MDGTRGYYAKQNNSVRERQIPYDFTHMWKLRNKTNGQPGWLSGLAPPLAQGVILETQDGVPRWAPCMEPASPSACVSASLSVSHK